MSANISYAAPAMALLHRCTYQDKNKTTTVEEPNEELKGHLHDRAKIAWNDSNIFCKETVNFYPFRDRSIGSYGPVVERINVFFFRLLAFGICAQPQQDFFLRSRSPSLVKCPLNFHVWKKSARRRIFRLLLNNNINGYKQ